MASVLDGEGTDQLGAAAAASRKVADRLDTPVLAPLRVLPVVGRQVRAATRQAAGVADGLEIAQQVGDDLQELMPDLGAGAQRVDALRRAAEVAAAGRQELLAVDFGPDEALVGPIASARSEIDDARDQAEDALARAEAVGAGLAQFFEGPSDYLLLAANNAQMQNGQGMFLSAGLLHVEDGSLDLTEMEPTSDLPRPSSRVPLDPDLEARWGWLDPNDDFRHLGLSHRFPVTASTAASLWAAAGRPAVDGVLMVDPFLLRAIMSATGPLALDDRELTEDAIVTYVLHDQYRGYLTARGDTSFGELRRDRLEELAEQAVADLDGLETIEPALVDRLMGAARGRHLMAWSADQTTQAGWEAAGIDGQIGADSLLLSLVNRSGNKLDWFVRTEADLEVTEVTGGHEAVLRITVHNRAPDEGEPAYVVGPYPGSGLAAGEYLGLVTLDLPAGARNGRFDGVEELAVAGADGPNRTIATWVRVGQGTSTEVVARFELPPGTDSLRVEPGARARPTAWATGRLEWEDRQARRIELPTSG